MGISKQSSSSSEISSQPSQGGAVSPPPSQGGSTSEQPEQSGAVPDQGFAFLVDFGLVTELGQFLKTAAGNILCSLLDYPETKSGGGSASSQPKQGGSIKEDTQP